MLVEFTMITNNEEHIFKVMGKWHQNVLTFPDKMTPNTLIDIIFDDNMVIINRHGTTRMYQEFKLFEKCDGDYENEMGIKLKIASYTYELSKNSHELTIDYDFFIENELESRNKLIIKY